MYQALYRKYRPKSFKDVIGQDHVTTTLKNEILSGRIAHAYLFIGSRGTGKTTCAKIFAKAVNCVNLNGGDPCGECEICKIIDAGESMDIVELDAASNNGVNDIREICESATFTPVQTKYRVYIIDEVHMLSAGAFNALLKTLEEPPDHVIFILATTEVYKIPATILSRCQLFEFHKISTADISSRLEYVVNKENAVISKEAAFLIAKVSDGAMRDALSILDKCIAISKNINAEIISDIIGIVSQSQIFLIIDSIIKNDAEVALTEINNFDRNSKDMLRLTFELINNFKDLLLIKTLEKAKCLLEISEENYVKLQELSQNLTVEKIIFIMDALQLAFEKMNSGCDAKTELEVCIIKLSSPELNYSIKEIFSRLDKIEKEVSLLKLNSNKEKTLKRSNDLEKNEGQEQHLEKKDLNNVNFKELYNNAKEMTNWNQVLEILKEYSTTISVAFKGSKAYISGDFVLIDSKNEMAFELLRKSSQRDKIRTAIKNITGKAYKLGPYNMKDSKEKESDPLKELENVARSLGIDVNKK